MVERRRLTQPQEKFTTGLLEWELIPENLPAYQLYNIVAAGRPLTGPSYVLRFIGRKRGERTFYLFRTMHDDKSRYLDCRPEKRMRELCRVAEDHARRTESEVVSVDHREHRPVDTSPPPAAARRSVGAQRSKAGSLF